MSFSDYWAFPPATLVKHALQLALVKTLLILRCSFSKVTVPLACGLLQSLGYRVLGLQTGQFWFATIGDFTSTNQQIYQRSRRYAAHLTVSLPSYLRH